MTFRQYQLLIALIVGTIVLVGFVLLNNSRSNSDTMVNTDKKEVPLETPTASSLPNPLATSPQQTTNSIQSGQFNRFDNNHFAEGKVTVRTEGEKVFIDFPENFKAAKGPDLFVYASQEQDLRSRDDLDISKTKNIGRLKSISGKQTYEISKAEFEQYNHSIVIWCRLFDTQFSNAVLQ